MSVSAPRARRQCTSSQRSYVLPLLVPLLLSTAVVSAYRSGDFIQAARKAQFHGQRTNWHDLVGEACPRFGRDRLVVVTLPKPVSQTASDSTNEYKVQFGFDGDRHLTHWLKLIGKGAPSVPMMRVTLKRSGEELIGVSGQVVDAPIYLQHTDPHYVSQWRNATHWPKRILLAYKWETHNDIDLDRGLAVLLVAGLAVGIFLAINAALGAGPKLTQFLSDIATELSRDDTIQTNPRGNSSAAVAGPSGGAGGSGGGAGAGLGYGASRPVAPPTWKGGGKGE